MPSSCAAAASVVFALPLFVARVRQKSAKAHHHIHINNQIDYIGLAPITVNMVARAGVDRAVLSAGAAAGRPRHLTRKVCAGSKNASRFLDVGTHEMEVLDTFAIGTVARQEGCW